MCYNFLWRIVLIEMLYYDFSQISPTLFFIRIPPSAHLFFWIASFVFKYILEVGQIGNPGCTYSFFLGGVCRLILRIWTLFQTWKSNLLFPISGQTEEIHPCFGPEKYEYNYKMATKNTKNPAVAKYFSYSSLCFTTYLRLAANGLMPECYFWR